MARVHLHAALEAHERSNALPWTAWTHYELARSQRADDPGAARSHREKAGATARALGMGRLEQAVGALPD